MLSRKRLANAIIVAAVAAIPALAGAQTVYTGTNNGDWNTPGNWSAGAPTGAVDARVNNNASAVNANLAAGQIGNVLNLTIDAGDSVTVNNNANLNINGNLVNNGTLQFLPTANTTFITFNGGTAATPATITGTGVLNFNFQTGSSFDGQLRGSGVVLNQSTIAGHGTIQGGFDFNNAGLIDANQSNGAQLYWDLWNSGTPVTNTGTIRSTAGGLLSLAGDNGGSLNSTGGNIQANGAGSITRFINGAVVNGGAYSTTGGGEIVVETGHSASISPTSLSGILRVRNNATLNINGTLNNTGTIFVSPTANNSFLRLNGNLTLNGNGSVYMNPTGGNAQIDGIAVLTNGASHLIHGSGSIAAGQTNVINNGTINADVSGGGIYVDAQNAGGNTFVNNNLVEATNGASFTIDGANGGSFGQGALGVFKADGLGSAFRLQGNAAVTGGSLTSSNNATIRVVAGSNASIADATLTTGTVVTLENSTTLNIGGTIVNNGTINVGPGTNGTETLRPTGTTNLNGTGTIALNYFTQTVGQTTTTSNANLDGSATLNIGSGQTIRGWGSLAGGSTTIINNGIIAADVSGGGIYIDAANAAGNTFTNNNIMKATAGATLTLDGGNGGSFDNTLGTVRADGAGAIVALQGGQPLLAGTLTTTAGGVIQVNQGTNFSLTDSTLTTGSNIAVKPGASLFLGTTGVNSFTNNGTITVTTSATTDAALRFEGTAPVSGTGTIVLDSSLGHSAFIGGAGSMTIGSGQTIRGWGTIGQGGTTFINNGTISADVGGGGIYIDAKNVGGESFTNNGTMKAAAGASLTFDGTNGGGLDNTNGLIRADGANAVVNLQGGQQVLGGTLTTTTGGMIQIPAGAPISLTNSTLTAGSSINVRVGSTLYLGNTAGHVFTNNGTITAASSATTNSAIRSEGDLSLNGTGTIVLDSSLGSSAFIGGAGSVTIAATQTIRGWGTIGQGATVVTNNGLIAADVPGGGIYIDAKNIGGYPFINNATMKATAGATLTFDGTNGGSLDNSNGIVRADGANAVVNFQGGQEMLSGTLTTTTGGLIQIAANAPFSFTDSTLTAGSNIAVRPNATLYLGDNVGKVWTNNGTITVATSAGANSQIRSEGTLTLNGTGSVVLDSSLGNSAFIGGSGSVTIGAGQTVRGWGTIGQGATTFVNNGTISSDVNGGGIYIDAKNAGGSVFTNNGTIRATNGAKLNLSGENGGAFDGLGGLVVDANSVIEPINGAAGNVGKVTGAGTWRANNSSNLGVVAFTNASLDATNSGVARITAGGGNAGTSKVTSLTTSNSGKFDVTDHGIVIDYTGTNPTAAIRGYLVSGYNGGNWTGVGIMSSLANLANGHSVGYVDSSVAGTSGTFLGQSYDATSILIRYTLGGDATLNGGVDFNDLVPLAQNYNATSNTSWAKGDFNYDGLVNFNDLVILAQNYNQTALADGGEMSSLLSSAGPGFAADWALAQSLVPEPTSLTALAGLATIALRRRKSQN